MGDLEDVEAWQAGSEQRWVDPFLDVAGQQEPTIADAAEEHDRDVVDARPRVRRRGWDLAADRPQDPQVQLVDTDAIPGRKPQSDRRTGSGEPLRKGGIAGPWPAHPRLEDLPDPVPIEEQRKAGDMVLVRMREDHRIDPAVPRRDPPIEPHEQSVRVGAAVDEQAATTRPLDEDRVALPDIEDHDARDTGRSTDDDGPRHRHGHHERQH
ncbi:MAG TPA: hypothetical protein VD763_03370, partial [Candidatus Saccharimonadales bacterium]|nr:hypothetical protein [Candidatus Saccharimonadales bacterium]